MVAEEPVVVIREFDAGRDCPGVAAVERVCEVGSSGGGGGKLALLTDLLGDPICRVRHSPAFLMLVAETGPPEEREIVGVVRGCVKTVTCGKRITPRDGNPPAALCTKVAYLLGLRVSSSHRRMGVGLRLVRQMEDWFRANGRGAAAGETDGGLVQREGCGVLVHGDGQGQRGVAPALHRPLRLLQVSHPLHPRPARLRPPPPPPPPLHRPPPPPLRRRAPLPPPLLHRRVLPPRHRRRPRQPPLPRHLPRRRERRRRRRLEGDGGVPGRPPGVVGGAQCLELQGRVPAGAAGGLPGAAVDGHGQPRGRPGPPVAGDPVGAGPVPAVRALLPLRGRRGGAGGGAAAAGALRARPQHGAAGRVRGGGGGGGGGRAAAGGDPALAAAVVRRGPLVHEAARRRLQRRRRRRLDQGPARAVHFCGPPRDLTGSEPSTWPHPGHPFLWTPERFEKIRAVHLAPPGPSIFVDPPERFERIRAVHVAPPGPSIYMDPREI